MVDSLAIRAAATDEADYLSDLALRSKAHWGYSQEFLESCRAELRVDPHGLGDGNDKCFVAVQSNSIVGFYKLEILPDNVFELGALFVEPEHIGQGIGRRLIEHALTSLSKLGGSRLIIQGDPNATRFYLAAGARQSGVRESGSIPGRLLPLFEIDLSRL